MGNTLIGQKKIHQMIDDEVEMDVNKLYDNIKCRSNLEQTVEVGRSKIIGIKELMEARTDYLSNHPLLLKAGPSISEVEHHFFGPPIALTAFIEGAGRVFLAYRRGEKEAFRLLEMFDDSEHNDLLKGDSDWGATLDNWRDIQYYIIAEGERLASVSPERASFEFYEVK